MYIQIIKESCENEGFRLCIYNKLPGDANTVETYSILWVYHGPRALILSSGVILLPRAIWNYLDTSAITWGTGYWHLVVKDQEYYQALYNP